MRITAKGQVTIPSLIRQKVGLLPDTQVEFVVSGKKVYIQKTRGTYRRGRKLVETLRGAGTVQMTTAQIMALTRGECCR